jgi:hypothetical protein
MVHLSRARREMVRDPSLTQQEGQAVNGNSGIGRHHHGWPRRWSSQPVKPRAFEGGGRLPALRVLCRVVHAGGHGILIGA